MTVPRDEARFWLMLDESAPMGYRSVEEPIDMLRLFRAAWDDRGRLYALEWIELPKSTGWMVGGGRYRLIPTDDSMTWPQLQARWDFE